VKIQIFLRSFEILCIKSLVLPCIQVWSD